MKIMTTQPTLTEIEIDLGDGFDVAAFEAAMKLPVWGIFRDLGPEPDDVRAARAFQAAGAQARATVGCGRIVLQGRTVFTHESVAAVYAAA
jgi:hypothetical protein